MKEFVKLEKPRAGDRVAVVSPSAGLPGLFPWVQDLGLKRLKDVFGLEAKEYPTTREMGSSIEDRARDLQAAFADEENKAVISSIGGMDQIRLIKLLDPKIFQDNPKPFFGFSDNTHFHNFLWGLGIPSYYGGAIMTQFAMQHSMHEMTIEYLNHALLGGGEVELRSSEKYNDEGIGWDKKDSLDTPRKMEPNDGWFWDGSKDARGILWGGCVESLIVQSSAGIYLPNDNELEGTILFLETAEDIPEHWIVQYLITGMGERGWFERFRAVLVGRPKAWEFDKQSSTEEKARYREDQRKTVLETVRLYNKEIPIVQNLDFGHTDPQIPMPYGGMIALDAGQKKIVARF